MQQALIRCRGRRKKCWVQGIALRLCSSYRGHLPTVQFWAPQKQLPDEKVGVAAGSRKQLN